SVFQFALSSNTDTLLKTHTTPDPSPSAAGSAPPLFLSESPLPFIPRAVATSRPPNPVVGSGWPGRGEGSRAALQPRALYLAKPLLRQGGTVSSPESRRDRDLIAPTRKRAIDPPIEARQGVCSAEHATIRDARRT